MAVITIKIHSKDAAENPLETSSDIEVPDVVALSAWNCSQVPNDDEDNSYKRLIRAGIDIAFLNRVSIIKKGTIEIIFPPDIISK